MKRLWSFLDVLPGDQIFCKPLVHCIMYYSWVIWPRMSNNFWIQRNRLHKTDLFFEKLFQTILENLIHNLFFFFSSFTFFAPPPFNVIMYLVLPYSCYATLTPFKTMQMSSQLESEFKKCLKLDWLCDAVGNNLSLTLGNSNWCRTEKQNVIRSDKSDLCDW